MVGNLEQLLGLSRAQEFIPDERLVWDEDEEMAHLHLVSTSGLIKELNHMIANFLAQYLDEDSISVVVRVDFSHLKPIVVGERLVAGLRVTEVGENTVKFAVVVMRESTRVAEGVVQRAIVSRNYLRRKAFEAE